MFLIELLRHGHPLVHPVPQSSSIPFCQKLVPDPLQHDQDTPVLMQQLQQQQLQQGETLLQNYLHFHCLQKQNDRQVCWKLLILLQRGDVVVGAGDVDAAAAHGGGGDAGGGGGVF